MQKNRMKEVLVSVALALAAGSAASQNAPTAPAPAAPPAYGAPIGVDAARKAAMAAIAEARRAGFFMAVAVVDSGGNLVYFERMDNTQLGSAAIAIDKARSAVLFRRPTKAFQDIVAQGGAGLRILGLSGAVPVDGGVPLLEGGKIIGAIGASGGTNDQDGQTALAGVAGLR